MRQTVTYSFRGLSLQARDSRRVDSITSVGEMRSNTNCNVCIAKRFLYIACLNNNTNCVENPLSYTNTKSCI